MSGGDLLNLLIERDVFEEGFARFYIAEVRSISDLFRTIVLINDRWSSLWSNAINRDLSIGISNLMYVSLATGGVCADLDRYRISCSRLTDISN